MRRVFISYSLADSERAMQLEEILQSEGFSVSRADDLVSGSDWQASLLSSIRQCSVVVALVDDPTPNVMLELGYALGAAKQVFLVGGRETRIPFDIASLPIVRFDPHDLTSLFEIADAIRRMAEVETTPTELQSGRNHLKLMLENAAYLDEVAPQQFEKAVLEHLIELGFKAELMPAAHDGGYDIRVNCPDSHLMAVVEVKKYTRSSRVGVAIVRQLLGSMMISSANCGILVTTGEFSAAAQGMARNAPIPIVLLTLEELLAATRKSITTACS